MPVTERLERRRLVKRDAIVEAARVIVRDDGLHALTMRRIAEAIDYAPASLYAHFESREALLAELCRDGLAALRSALGKQAEGVHEPRARLTALSTAYVRFAREHSDTYRLIFMADPGLTKGVFESVASDDGARALALIAEPFAALRAEGKLRKSADPARLADVLWTIVHGIASLRIACPTVPATDDASLITTAVAALVEGSRPRTTR